MGVFDLQSVILVMHINKLCLITAMIGNTKKLIGIVGLVLAVLIICLDYLYVHEFKIEGKYLIAVVPLFAFDIYRRIQLNNKSIAIIVSLGVLVICIYQFAILLLLSWGYRFLGTDMPFIWILSMIVNSGLTITTLEEIYRNTKQNKL